MRKTPTFVLTLALVGAWGLASAQTQPNTLCDVREAKPKPGAKATAHDADMAATLLPYVEAPMRSMWRYRPELSRTPPADKGEAKYYAGTYYYLKPEAVSQLEDGLKQMRAVAEKAQYPRTSSWFQLVNGGEGPAFYQEMPRWSWADFDAPTPTLASLADEALGKTLADDLRRSITSSVRYTVSEMTKARPDLGYEPAKK